MTTVRIIPIGNSRGVRLPRHVLAVSGLDGEVEIDCSPGEVTLRALAPVRQGWDAAFADMAARGDDALVDGDLAAQSSFDDEWVWE